MNIDFNTKKTESEWQTSIDKFWKYVTPLWFEILEWVLILGVISYLANQTRNMTLRIVSSISYVFIFFYIQSLFYTIDFKGFPLVKTNRGQRILSIILSGITSFLVWILI